MLPAILVLASNLMLCTAQIPVQLQQLQYQPQQIQFQHQQVQLRPQQLQVLPNLAPVTVESLPNSQTLMMQSAHSILRQSGGALQPGVLGSLPVLVSEAAQSVLDQESKIVGYTHNLPPGLAVATQQPQQELVQTQVEPQPQAQPQVQTQQTQYLTEASPQQIEYRGAPEQIVFQAPQQQLAFQAPPEKSTQQVPPEQIVYQSPQQQVAYQGSPQQIVYQTVQEKPTHQVPQEQVVYQSPPEQIAYQGAAQQIVYQTAPESQTHQAPQEQIVYQSPPGQNLEDDQPQLQAAQLVAASPPVQIGQQEQEQPIHQQILVNSVDVQLHSQQPQVKEVQESPVTYQTLQQHVNVILQNSGQEEPRGNPQSEQVQEVRQETGSPSSTHFLYQTLTPQIQVPSLEQQPLQLQVASPTPPPSPLLYYTTHQRIPIANVQSLIQSQEEKQPETLQLLSDSKLLESPSPQLIPITLSDAVSPDQSKVIDPDEGQPIIYEPQSIELPIISSQPQQQELSVVPVRALASLKNLINSDNKRERNPSPQSSLFRSQSRKPKARPEASRTPIRQIAKNTRDSDIAYMRPPPPFQQQNRGRNPSGQNRAPNNYGRPEQGNDNRQQNQQNQQNRPRFTTTTPSPFDFPSSQVEDAIEISAGNDRTRFPQQSIGGGQLQGSSLRTSGGSGYDTFSPSAYRGSGYPRQQRVHKHIFVHAVPDPNAGREPRVRVIRPQINQEKHVNIIFVRSPTPNPETQTVVELPPIEQPKTLVYVLSKKPNENDEVKVVGPPQPKPSAPEIYFIRYGDNRGGTRDFPVANLQSLIDNANHGQGPSSGGQGSSTYEESLNRFKRDRGYGVHIYAPLMAYSMTGQINEITKEEAELRRTNLDEFF